MMMMIMIHEDISRWIYISPFHLIRNFPKRRYKMTEGQNDRVTKRTEQKGQVTNLINYIWKHNKSRQRKWLRKWQTHLTQYQKTNDRHKLSWDSTAPNEWAKINTKRGRSTPSWLTQWDFRIHSKIYVIYELPKCPNISMYKILGEKPVHYKSTVIPMEYPISLRHGTLSQCSHFGMTRSILK